MLPYRNHGKLTFPLCRTCVKENISKPLLDKTSACHHTDGQRALEGTWCTSELEVAVQKEYTITHIHEVWHFEKWGAGLSRSYLDTWLKTRTRGGTSELEVAVQREYTITHIHEVWHFEKWGAGLSRSYLDTWLKTRTRGGTSELEVAVQKEYTITHIHEVWHFEKWGAGLSRSYLDTWLKIEEEASRWPEGCTTPAQKQAHVYAYYAREGIHLDATKIEKNPGSRALDKMLLNSMWGKFG